MASAFGGRVDLSGLRTDFATRLLGCGVSVKGGLVSHDAISYRAAPSTQLGTGLDPHMWSGAVDRAL